MPERAAASAFARAALAGNPSDGYGGATLAVEIRDFSADVEAEAAAGGRAAVSPDSELVRVTVRRFAREHSPAAAGTSVRWRTTIPRAVGLGGSSAIVVATVRALADLHGVNLEAAALAEFALAVEVEELGITAGLQDRVAQAYGGLTFMDFSAGEYERLDPRLLPPLFLAWREEAGGHSGEVHAALRARHARGEPAVGAAMAQLAGLARTARDALLAGDGGSFAACVDASFDIRRGLMAVEPLHAEMIDRARSLGARANNAGSGGAIVGVCEDDEHLTAVVEALSKLGCGAIVPSVLPAAVRSR